MKRLGPELKMPELKAPDFLVDLYWDLRDRHLLPLVALGVVAIVAVPFLLGGGSKQPPQAPPSAALANTLSAAGAHASTLAVVQEKPGLRDYRKRLRGRRPIDPFIQRYTAPVLKGTKVKGGEEGASSSTSSTKTAQTEGPSNSAPTTTATSHTTRESQRTLYAFAIDVKTTRAETQADGSTQTGEPTVRHRVLAPAALPGENAQVVTFMGINPTTKNPLFLISDAVTAVFGEGKCLSGVSVCQLLEVEPGFPETFVYGENGVRYKINVLKVERVAVWHWHS